MPKARESRHHGGNAATHDSARRKPQRDDTDQKRKLWDRKQVELEARRAAAKTRLIQEAAAHKQKMRIAYGITGAVITVLLCGVAWYW